MHQDIPNDIAVSIKDKLRGLRYALRHTLHGQNEAEKPAVLPEVVLNRAAHIAATVMDKAFSTAETISISLVSDNPSIHETAPDVQSLSFYFNGSPEGQRAFHRDMYYLTKAVLHWHKAENLLIQEAVFKTIYTHQTTAWRRYCPPARSGNRHCPTKCQAEYGSVSGNVATATGTPVRHLVKACNDQWFCNHCTGLCVGYGKTCRYGKYRQLGKCIAGC